MRFVNIVATQTFQKQGKERKTKSRPPPLMVSTGVPRRSQRRSCSNKELHWKTQNIHNSRAYQLHNCIQGCNGPAFNSCHKNIHVPSLQSGSRSLRHYIQTTWTIVFSHKSLSIRYEAKKIVP